MGRWGLKGIIAVDACGGAVWGAVTDPLPPLSFEESCRSTFELGLIRLRSVH